MFPCLLFVVFFFKQKTAYEMRISDWSSDVCSSDLTSVENIYAVGDVTDRINLTPVAIQEAMAFVDTVFRGHPRAMDHADVPSAVFSHPPVSTVGLTELQARGKQRALAIYRPIFPPLATTHGKALLSERVCLYK